MPPGVEVDEEMVKTIDTLCRQRLDRLDKDIFMMQKLHSALDMSELKFVSNYCYLKVNFLVPENLL